MQGNPHVRFDERDVETELWSSHLGTARRKGRKQTCPAYRHRATSRLYPQQTNGTDAKRLILSYSAPCWLPPFPRPAPLRLGCDDEQAAEREEGLAVGAARVGGVDHLGIDRLEAAALGFPYGGGERRGPGPFWV